MRIRGGWTASWPRRLEILLPLAAYLVIVFTGATYSSLGEPRMREDPAHPMGHSWGAPEGMRSDEWLTQTPIELSVLSLGHSSHSPLAQTPDLTFQLSSGQPAETVLFFEGNILRLGPWLPDTWLFAAWRALPLLVLLLTLPPLLRRFGANRPLSWLAVPLVVLSPTSLWWSFTPVRIMATATLGSYLLVLARDAWTSSSSRGRRVGAGLLAAVAGIVLARLATYYVPWGLTIGIPVVVASVCWLLWSRPRSAGLVVLGIGAAVGGGLLLLTFRENWGAVQATLDSVYPGDRRSVGASLSPFQLLGAPGLYQLQYGDPPAIANQSEIASAYLLCLVWAGWLARSLLPTDAAKRAALVGLTAVTVLWLLWCTVTWGSWAQHLPLLNRVEPPRSAQTVGYAAALILCVVLSRVERTAWRGSVTVAAICGLVTAYGVSNLQQAIPSLTTTDIWAVSAVTAVLVLLVTHWPTRALPVLAVTAVLAYSGYLVNPVNFGLGDLRASDSAAAARRLGHEARSHDAYVASDSPFVSGLLVANGVPMLNGYQTGGPDRDAWAVLDRDGTQEDGWNRGSSFIWMSFDRPAGEPPQITNPNPDVIQVSVDPCELAELDVAYLVSGANLENPCLTKRSTFEWAGAPQFVFSVAPASASG
jgi:hypothetical protein